MFVFLWICLFLCVLDGVHHRVGRADAKDQLPLDPVVGADDIMPSPHVWVPGHFISFSCIVSICY